MLFSKQTPAAGGTAFAQFDAAWAYDGNGYIFNDTGTSLDVRIGASGSVQTLAAGGTLPIKLVFSMAELYVRRTDQSTTQVTVEAQVGTGSAGGGGSTSDMAVIAAASTAAHNSYPAAHGQTSLGRSLVTAASSAAARAALEIPTSSTSVTATGSTTDRTFAERFADVANVLDFGAQGTNSDTGFDSLAAFNAALATGKPVYVPPPPSGSFYRVSDTVVVSNGRALFGPRGGLVRIRCTHAVARPTITINGSGGQYVANIWPESIAATSTESIGILVDAGAHPAAITRVRVSNIYMGSHGYGLRISGACYFSLFENLTILYAKKAPIRLDDRDGTSMIFGGVPSGPNSNTFIVNELTGQSTTPPGTGSACVWIQRGGLNTFIGGELGTTESDQQLDYIVNIEQGNSNRFIGNYTECALGGATKMFKLGNGVQVHWAGAGFVQGMDIGTDCKIIGAGGMEIEYNNAITQETLNWQKACTGLYFCNEGAGDVILDHSGNGRHLRMSSATPTWSDGKFGKAIDIDISANKYLALDSYVASLAPETEFTVVALIKRTGAQGNPVFMVFANAARYHRVDLQDTYKAITDYDGAGATTENPMCGMIATRNLGYQWVAFTINPTSGTMKWLDPVNGAKAGTTKRSPWVAGGGTGLTQLRIGNQYGSSGVIGSLCFLGFWNRALSMGEVLDLVNMRVPALWSGRPQHTQKVLEYGVDGATTTRSHRYGSAAPTTGAWLQGDVVFNTTPAAGGSLGWVCTTAGTPGTWKTFGAIAA